MRESGLNVKIVMSDPILFLFCFDPILFHYDGGKLKYVGKVRAGFVPHMRCAMMPLLDELSTDTCPFVDLPETRRTLYSLTRDEMQSCRWVKPLVVAQINFQEWTPDGHLRHASFAGLRNDKEPLLITRE